MSSDILLLYLSYSLLFNDPATTEIYTLSLHDALPISMRPANQPATSTASRPPRQYPTAPIAPGPRWSRYAPTSLRSEEHTSELQSLRHLVCRLLLEKKKKRKNNKHKETHNKQKRKQNI